MDTHCNENEKIGSVRRIMNDQITISNQTLNINLTDSLAKMIWKVFLKKVLESESHDQNYKRDQFILSIGNLNNNFKKLDLTRVYEKLLSLSEGDSITTTDTTIETKAEEPLGNAVDKDTSVFKKRKKKFVVADNSDDGTANDSGEILTTNKKMKAVPLDFDSKAEEDYESSIGLNLIRLKKKKTNQNIANPATPNVQVKPQQPIVEKTSETLLQVEALQRNIQKLKQEISDQKNQMHRDSTSSSSYIENEYFKLIPISIKQRLELIPPFLIELNRKYNISTSVISNDDYILKIIMGSLIPSNDNNIVDAQGNVEVSNDESGELTVSCSKNSKILMDHKKLVENMKHIKNIVLNDEIQKKESEGEEVAQEEVVDDDEKIMFDEEVDESEPEFIDNSQNLPVYACKRDFLNILNENQVILVIGETGSGKTTQLPKYIYQQDPEFHNIAVTQPRRVAAINIAKRVSQEMGCKLGKEVGYSVRFDEKTTKGETKIKIMTEGVLLREFINTQKSTAISSLPYSHIIIDEAHERSLNTDVLLGFIKNLLLSKQKNRNMKFIITSATINYKIFLQHFPNAPIFKIPGKTFPIQSIFLKRPCLDYIESIIQNIVKLHLSNPVDSSNDILCFMTGQEDIEVCCSLLNDKLTQVYAENFQANLENDSDTQVNNFVILPLYSTLSPKKQAMVFKKYPGKRKIVFSTNVAETSVTIDGIKFVIDSGFHKLKLYNSKIGLNILKTAPISKDMSVQRQGRAGRTQPGIVYKMYTESCFNFELLKNSIPEIKRTNLSNVLLMLLSSDSEKSMSNILKFPFLEKPSKLTMLSSFLELYNLNAIDNLGELTELGCKMANIPITPNLSKMLILSTHAEFDCLKEILIIVGMLSIESGSGAFFQRPKNFEKIADNKRLNFIIPYSDHLSLLNLYTKWKYNNCSSKWCERNFINHRSLMKVDKIITQLETMIPRNHTKKSRFDHKKTWENVKKCITTGYSYKNIGKKTGLNKYISLQNGMSLQIHPTSSLFGLPDLPPYIIYHDLLLTSKEYINCVTAVDPVWIMEYQPLYFSIDLALNEERQKSPENVKMELQLSHLQNFQKLNMIFLDKQKELSSLKEQYEREQSLLSDTAMNQSSTYSSNTGSLKAFKKRRKLGL